MALQAFWQAAGATPLCRSYVLLYPLVAQTRQFRAAKVQDQPILPTLDEWAVPMMPESRTKKHFNKKRVGLRQDMFDRPGKSNVPFTYPLARMKLLEAVWPKTLEVQVFEKIKEGPGYDSVRVSYDPLLEFNFDAIGSDLNFMNRNKKLPRTPQEFTDALISEDPKQRLALPLRFLNDKICTIIKGCARNAMFRLMDALIGLWGNKATHFVFFQEFVSQVDYALNRLSPQHLVQTLHYLGMTKGHSVSEHLAGRLEETVANVSRDYAFSFEELAIVCAAFHKMNYRIRDRRLLDYIRIQAVEGTYKLMSGPRSDVDVFPVIAVIKILRHAKVKDVALNEAVAKFLRSVPADTTSVAVLYHMAAVLANTFYVDTEALQKLEDLLARELTRKKATRQLLSTHPSQTIRVKDIQGVLWVFASLNFPIQQQTVDLVVEYMRNAYYKEYEYMALSYPLVDSLTSLAMMGHYFPDLAKHVFSQEVVDSLKEDDLVRHLNKLMLLEMAYNLETGTTSNFVKDQMNGKTYVQRTVKQEILVRPELRRFWDLIRSGNPPDVGLQLRRGIRPIEIANIRVSGLSEREVSLELLDETNCLVDKNGVTNQSVGIFSFKLRLMEALGVQVVVLRSKEVEGKNPQHIWNLIRRKVSAGLLE